MEWHSLRYTTLVTAMVPNSLPRAATSEGGTHRADTAKDSKARREGVRGRKGGLEAYDLGDDEE